MGVTCERDLTDWGFPGIGHMTYAMRTILLPLNSGAGELR